MCCVMYIKKGRSVFFFSVESDSIYVAKTYFTSKFDTVLTGLRVRLISEMDRL